VIIPHAVLQVSGQAEITEAADFQAEVSAAAQDHPPQAREEVEIN
jgi:hypothetical protein